MKSALSLQKFAALPLHDAEFISLGLNSSDQGEVSLQILIEWHEDEFEQARIDTGITTQRVTLTYDRCWRIVSNVLGYGIKRELIDDWEVSSGSDMIEEFRSHGFAENTDLKHYKITFSGGSSLDILAESVFLDEGGARPNVGVPE